MSIDIINFSYEYIESYLKIVFLVFLGTGAVVLLGIIAFVPLSWLSHLIGKVNEFWTRN